MPLPSGDQIIATFRGSEIPGIIWTHGSDIAVLKYNYQTGERKVEYYADDSNVYPIYKEGDLLQSKCDGTNEIVLLFGLEEPYFYIYYRYNSPNCGYIPPSCDIVISLVAKADCTTPDNNNGGISVLAYSSYNIVSYTLGADTNTSGTFLGLTPGDYTIYALDSNGCQAEYNFTIYPFNSGLTDLKYVLEFTGVMSSQVCRLEFHDKKNLYDNSQYPKELTGANVPVRRETKNSSEDKTEPICPSSLTIGLLHNDIFTLDEFALADERTWYIKYYIGSQLKFQGWLLPDEVQDFYEDVNYYVELKASDGLLSLKGVDYTDGTGIQQFGVFSWKSLVYNCLSKLDYDLGTTILFSSLRYNDSFDNLLWNKISTWADLFYDDNGDPKSSYDVLELLVKGLGLCLFQHNGQFVLVHWNDLYHIQNPIKSSEFNRAIYSFNSDFTALSNGNTLLKADMALVGHQRQLRPVAGNHTINYDKAYGILEADINFSYFTLLYPNPSFEIGAVQGDLPFGWKDEGVIDAGLDNNATAYTGNWVFQLYGNNTPIPLNPLEPSNYLSTGNFVDQTEPGYVFDQVNKSVSLSFYWRPIFIDDEISAIPAYAIIFIRDSDGLPFVYRDNEARGTPGTPRWEPVTDANPYSPVRQFTTDYQQWNNFTVTTPGLQETGRIFIRLYAPLVYTEDGILPNNQDDFPDRAIQIDQYEVTFKDASDSYNKQLGEKHIATTNTNYARAQKKTLTLDLFTFPSNKRVAGNIFYGTDYLTGVVANNWGFALGNNNSYDRLPASIVKQFAKQYQRPVYIFEGDVIFTQLNYYCVFLLAEYDGLVFMPLSIQWDDKNGIASITMVQINDEPAQNTYTYRAKYEKLARKVQ